MDSYWTFNFWSTTRTVTCVFNPLPHRHRQVAEIMFANSANKGRFTNCRKKWSGTGGISRNVQLKYYDNANHLKAEKSYVYTDIVCFNTINVSLMIYLFYIFLPYDSLGSNNKGRPQALKHSPTKGEVISGFRKTHKNTHPFVAEVILVQISKKSTKLPRFGKVTKGSFVFVTSFLVRNIDNP